RRTHMSASSLPVAFILGILLHPSGLPTAGAMDDPATDIEEQLRRPVSINVRDTPARDVLEVLCNAEKVDFVIDYVALAKGDIDLSHTISFQLDQIALRSALKLLLDKVGATYRTEGGVLKVTAKEAIRGPLVLKFYCVHELVRPATKKGESGRANLKARVS